jgi:hypothetical protein
MDPVRKSALVTGVLFIATFVTSILPQFGLYPPILNDSHYVLGVGQDTRIFVGAFLEVLLVISGIGTAVAIFPVVKRQHEGLALGYVAARTFEAAMVAVGIISLLAVVSMRREFAGSGTDAATFVVVGKALVAVRKWTFLIGPGFCPGIENGLILGYLLYRSRLVPRPIAVLGLIAGPLALIAGTGELFQVFPQISGTAAILTFPEALFEAVLGIWLAFRGFRPSPVTAGVTRHTDNSVAPDPTAA